MEKLVDYVLSLNEEQIDKLLARLPELIALAKEEMKVEQEE